ncbi:MAG: hypothetical protein IJE46_05535 [Clostridia bacterium]|nr:hypothetical protein [Clostridia bacterium]
MKKAFIILSVFLLILIGTFSVSALENSMTNTSLTSTADGYTFECVITPSVTSECMPVIAAYDSTGVLCGLMYGDSIPLTEGVRTVETFKVDMADTPTSIKLMMWKTDGSFAPLCKFEQVSTALYSEKFGMITELNSSGGVQIFSTDGSYTTYTLNDNVVLSHGNTVVSGKTSATSHIDSLKFTYYTRTGTLSSLWKIFKNERTCYKDTSGSTSQVYKYPDFLDNYTKRVIRFLSTSDGKISSIALADDTLFNKISSGDKLTAAFYTLSTRSFNDKITLNNDTKILYLPAKYGASESDYAVKSPSELKNGNYYHTKTYTTSGGSQIVLLTYMFTDADTGTFNTEPINYINITLNGNGSNVPGIKNYSFNIAISGQSDDNNDAACDAAALAMEYVAQGLQGALDATNSGYVITPEFVKIKFKNEISAAKQQINILKQMDENLKTKYYGELENLIPLAIGNEAANFLQDYFLGN